MTGELKTNLSFFGFSLGFKSCSGSDTDLSSFLSFLLHGTEGVLCRVVMANGVGNRR